MAKCPFALPSFLLKRERLYIGGCYISGRWLIPTQDRPVVLWPLVSSQNYTVDFKNFTWVQYVTHQRSIFFQYGWLYGTSDRDTGYWSQFLGFFVADQDRFVTIWSTYAHIVQRGAPLRCFKKKPNFSPNMSYHRSSADGMRCISRKKHHNGESLGQMKATTVKALNWGVDFTDAESFLSRSPNLWNAIPSYSELTWTLHSIHSSVLFEEL